MFTLAITSTAAFRRKYYPRSFVVMQAVNSQTNGNITKVLKTYTNIKKSRLLELENLFDLR